MNKYYYIESVIPLNSEDEIDLLAHEKFSSTGIEEFAIEESKVDEILGERSYSGGDVPVSVISEVEEVLKNEGIKKKYYFNTEAEAKTFLTYLKENFSIESTYYVEEVKDWNEEWKKTYAPILVSDQLEVIPEWEKNSYNSRAKNPLYIYPGRGFGTGSHETTFLCLSFLVDLVKEQKDFSNCLDFGCGSGILGIAYRLFYESQEKIDLYDIDAEALENSIQNIELNNLDKTEFNLLLPKERTQIDKKYSLVFANILQNVLLLESDYLANCLKEGGYLILSGLLKGQETEVIESMKKSNSNIEFVQTLNKGDWVAVLMRAR